MCGSGEIVSIARSWIGTPYRHQAACKGAGTDCLGLIRGIWRERFGREPEKIPAYTLDWSEPQGHEALWAAAARHLTEKPKTKFRPGDVLLFRMQSGAVAKHLGVVSQSGDSCAFIHAYTRHGVIESPLSSPWQRRIVACFEFPQEVR